MKNRDELKNRIAGALYGVAVGDALGGPVEFMTAPAIVAKYGGPVEDMVGGGWLYLRPGETTDDTAMTLAVAEGIMETKGDNPIAAIGKRFIEWARSGPKDIGGTCSASIHAAERIAAEKGEETPSAETWCDAAEEVAKLNGGRSGGNGALMRTIYPALYYKDKETAISVASAQGLMTHWDKESREACKIYARVVHCFIAEGERGDSILPFIEGALRETRYNLEEVSKAGRAGDLRPTGYSVDSLLCALYAFWDASTNFKEAVTYAVNLGGDADTIGAICGGLAGALYGYNNIPTKWLDALSAADRTRLDAAVEAALESWEA